MAKQKLQNVFIDYAKRLQGYLDEISPGTFLCGNEKELEVNDEDKVHVIVSKLTGTSNEDSVAVPIMLKIYTCKESPENIIGAFIGLSKAKATSFYSEIIDVDGVLKEGMVFEQINTPAVSQYDVQFGTNNHWTELVCFCDILVLFEIGNVKNLKIDGEEIKFLNSSIAFATTPMTNRVSGEQLNKQKNMTASTNLHIQMIFKTGIFTRKIWDMFWGDADKNTIFTVDVELTNGFIKNGIKMVVNSDNYNTNRQKPTLPSLDVTLTLADTRTM